MVAHPVMDRLVRPTLVLNRKGLVVVALDTDYLRSIDFVSLAYQQLPPGPGHYGRR